MKDEDQIIINGVDVSECLFYQSNFEEDYDVKIKHFCSNWHNSCESINNSNCYFKQLARKTQECEELKKYIQEREVWGDQCEFCKHNDKENCHQNIILDNLKTINRYRKALDEIEELNNINCNYLIRNKILDIINKVKEL